MEDGMASSTSNSSNYDMIVSIVRGWPASQRFALVQEVLATLAPETPAVNQRQSTLARARGFLATDQVPPSDEDIEAMLDERRQERYGL